MKKVMLAISAVSVFFYGCASVPKPQTDRDVTAKKFIAAAGKSSLYIFRKKRMSSALSIPLSVDGKLIGQSEPFTYFLVNVEPGQHKINCEDNTNESFMVTTRPNQIYFIRQVMKNGFSSVSCKFQEVTATEGKDAVNECNLVQDNL